MAFPHYSQEDSMDCGIACLRMIAKYYGKDVNSESLKMESGYDLNGVSISGLRKAAKKIGFKTLGIRATIEMVSNKVPLPCILHWGENHFVVLYDVKMNNNSLIFCIADPGQGLQFFYEKDFINHWCNNKVGKGVVLLFENNDSL